MVPQLRGALLGPRHRSDLTAPSPRPPVSGLCFVTLSQYSTAPGTGEGRTTVAEPVTYELEGRIATITMDDGKVNVFSIPMLRPLHAAFDQAEGDGAVVVLTGREGYFSAGFDLKVLAGPREQIMEILTLGATLAERVLSFPDTRGRGLHRARLSGRGLPPSGRRPADRSRRAVPDRPQRGEDRHDRPVVRHRDRPPAPRPRALRPHRRQRHHVRPPARPRRPGSWTRWSTPGALRAASLEGAAELAELDPVAHAATKRRARAGALAALRSAIDSELAV